MQDGVLTGAQAAEAAASGADFADAAQEKKFLTAEQIATLRKSVPDESARFAEALFRQGRGDYQRLGDLLSAGRATDDPVRTAVARMDGNLLPDEVERYSDFVAIFLRSVIRFMDTPAVISNEAPNLNGDMPTYAASQRLMGDLTLVTGLLAKEAMFVDQIWLHALIAPLAQLRQDSCEGGGVEDVVGVDHLNPGACAFDDAF